MWKLVLAALALSASIGSLRTNAQTQITLIANTSGNFTFTPTGPLGAENYTLSSNISGKALGTGGLLSNLDNYSITGSPVILTLDLPFNPPTQHAEYDATGMLDLKITDPSMGNAVVLEGMLSLVDLVQNSISGQTNTSLVANLTSITGPLWAPFAPEPGVIQLTLDLTNAGFLPHPGLGTPSPQTADLLTSSITPAPEVASILLFGTGLLFIGKMLRRKQLAT